MEKIEEHKEKIGIPKEHTLHLISERIKSIKGTDVDLILYEERDKEGNKIATYTIEDGISKYPQHEKVFSFKKEE